MFSSRLRLMPAMLAAASLLTASFYGKAFAADAKTQLTERERHCAAAGVSGTVAEAMECFSSSPDVTAYDVFTPREFDGPEAIRGYFQNYFGSGYQNAKIEFVYLHVTTNGTIGYTHSVQHFSAVAKNGTTFDGYPRVSDVWRKENGTWKIILTHASFPVDPATLKADMQSKP